MFYVSYNKIELMFYNLCDGIELMHLLKYTSPTSELR